MSAYEIKLSAFEGPLDLLLHLISKAKIDIKDIFISQITEQYLEYIEDMPEDMELASDFLQMAATLIYIKSRALLPRAKDEDIDEDGLTPEERLIVKLEEYKRYKAVSQELRELEQDAALSYYKLPEEVISLEGSATIYSNADADALCRLFLNAMSRAEKRAAPPPEVKIREDSFNVRRQMKVIMARLSIVPKLTFDDLLSSRPGREEIAVTFLSLLELLHKNAVRVRQDSAFGGIYISKAEGKDADERTDRQD